MFCKYCGKELSETLSHCPHCGKIQTESPLENNKSTESIPEATPKGSIGGGISTCIIGFILFFVRSSIKSSLYRKSIRTGWAGLYDEPFIVSALLYLGIIFIALGLYLIIKRLNSK